MTLPIDQLKSMFEEPTVPEDQTREMINSMDHFEIARLLHQLGADQKVLIFQYIDEKKIQNLDIKKISLRIEGEKIDLNRKVNIK